jgi:hypothetical protein
MKFEWDEKKNSTNLLKHNISFNDAALIFTDKNSLSLFDDENSELEDRWITIGQHPNGSIYVVVHTYRKFKNIENMRIISARKATKNEIKNYYMRSGK